MNVMARIVPLAEVFKADVGEQLPAIRGKVVKVGKYFSGQGEKGPWSFQSFTLDDGTAKLEVKFKGRDRFDETAIGKVMFITANNGERGLTGVRAEDDDYKGKVTRIALVTPSAEVVFGKGDWTQPATTNAQQPTRPVQSAKPADDGPPVDGSDGFPGDEQAPARQAQAAPAGNSWDALKLDVNRIRKLHLMCCAAAAHNVLALHKAGISVGDEFLQASVATIFIEACKRGGIASIPDHGEPPVNFPKFEI